MLDALTPRHLPSSGEDCKTRESANSPWRRWFNHATVYGFLLCVASTSVAALYHASGRLTPYPLFSLPVVLGALGGIGMIAGSIGLHGLRRRRVMATADPAQKERDGSFILVLVLTVVTGILVLTLRESAKMGPLLMIHLGFILTLFLTLPYGKFVHGLRRTAALIRHARESLSYVPPSEES